MRTRYFVTIGDEPEREVTVEEYVSIEARAGFNGSGHFTTPPEPACASFGGSYGDGRPDMAGRTEPLS